jgi:hypothetical protein
VGQGAAYCLNRDYGDFRIWRIEDGGEGNEYRILNTEFRKEALRPAYQDIKRNAHFGVRYSVFDIRYFPPRQVFLTFLLRPSAAPQQCL